MADDKRGRDRKAHDAERRRRERDLAMELERWDETEPPVETTAVAERTAELDVLAFPATGAEVIETVGHVEIAADDEAHAVEGLVADAESETFDSAAAVRARVQRPTVAAEMKRVIEAGLTLQNDSLDGSRREAYEKTFRALKAVDADDDDEGVRAIGDWIVEQVEGKRKLPGSRAVRRQAAKYCRSNGYAIRDDEWLGV